MKKTRILWGIAILLSAILLILDVFGVAFGLPEGISVWKVILGGLIFCWFINEIIHLRIYGIFFPIAFIVMLFERELALLLGIESGNIASGWEFLLVALLLTVGVALIIPKKRKPRNKVRVDSGHRGNRTHYIDCSTTVGEYIENNISFCEVFFTNVEMYQGGGSVRLENNLGRIDLHIPKEWQVSLNIENNLGSVDAPPPPKAPNGTEAKKLDIMGENNLGKVTVIFD